MSRYRWAQWGDVNAFFGLALDNLAVMVLLVGAISSSTPRDDRFSPQFVMEYMIPGSALGVLLGDLAYTAMAFRLARRSGKSDITAMPLGLDTPSTFGVALLVLLPALQEGKSLGMDYQAASLYAWRVGALVLVLMGLFKSLLAPLGNAVRHWVPRAALLGSLAAVALALIAFIPLLGDVAAVPVVGVLSFAVILVTLVARRTLPGKIPGALAAFLAGMVVYYLCDWLGGALGWPLVPHAEAASTSGTMTAGVTPRLLWNTPDWRSVCWAALGKMPIMLPFALADVVGGIDCTESAAAAGDEYDTRAVLLTEGLASVAAGLCGGVIQNTPYIGQPAYKAMGGRAAYTLATALFIGAAGFFGWFTQLFAWLPRPALFPILVYVGLEITSQSFRATPARHYSALALAMLPGLAYMATIPLDIALAGRDVDPAAAGLVQTLRCLANGFLVTSLLWAAALAALIDGRLVRSGVYFLIAAGCALIGIIHSPFHQAVIALPGTVMARLPDSASFQSPYVWAASYVLTAVLLFALARVRTGSLEEKGSPPAEKAESRLA
jgi:AGZA family xanthine/uracil permease-like MFS transporter